MSVERLLGETQQAYGVPPGVAETYLSGVATLSDDMPNHVQQRKNEASLAWADVLCQGHDYINGVLQPVVNKAHDVRIDVQTPLRTIGDDDLELQPNYKTICEYGVPRTLSEAEQTLNIVVREASPVLIGRNTYRDGRPPTPFYLGQLNNQDIDRFKEQPRRDLTEEARQRASRTELTGFSAAKRSTLVNPKQLYHHQVDGPGSMSADLTQRRMVDYFTFQMPKTNTADEAYEALRRKPISGQPSSPFMAYVFNAFDKYAGKTPADPGREIDL